MLDLKKLVRPNVLALKPYQSARDEFQGQPRISLDANENPFGFGLNRYPEAGLTSLKQKFGRYRGVQPEQLIFGNGSDELIDLLIRSFCEPKKDKILVFTPTFGMYAVCAAINDVEVVSVPLNNQFDIELGNLKSTLKDESIKLLFICSPNNPTGNLIDGNLIHKACEIFQGIVVLDEAYADFSKNTMVGQEIENLFILQTFSKAFGLAGIRLGVGIGDQRVVDILNKVKPPYNVNSLTQDKAIQALERPDEIRRNIEILIEEREKLKKALEKLDNVVQVYPSQANFLLVQFDNANKVYNELADKGIILRDRSQQIDQALRITIGTPSENAELLAALQGQQYEVEGRIGEVTRKTSETEIYIKVNLDDPIGTSIATGVSFFDHMLDQLARHGGIGLNIQVKGDIDIDTHHTIEDTALALGSAFDQALKERKGIERYGFLLPMDDCLAQVAIDFGGRPWLEWSAKFEASHLGAFPTEMASHFFKSFSDTARCNLNIKAEGDNDHHKIESIFKAFARAIKMAVRRDESGVMPSTKGVL